MTNFPVEGRRNSKVLEGISALNTRRKENLLRGLGACKEMILRPYAGEKKRGLPVGEYARDRTRPDTGGKKRQ